MMTKLEAAKELITYDHAFLSPEGAQRLAEPFGVKLRMQKVKANTGAFKGLTVDGVGRGAKVAGMDARDLAYMLAEHEGLKPRSMFGRGSGLREAAGLLIESLSK